VSAGARLLLTTTIALDGEWDYYRSAELRALFERDGDAQKLVVDLTRTRYIDSTLLTELVRLRQRRASKGLDSECLVISNPDVKRIFEITKLDTLWTICTTLEEAQKR